MTEPARLFGVGVGPGDPELLTLKAFRTIRDADVIAYLVNDKQVSQAKTIACLALEANTSGQVELPIYMPMSEDRCAANNAYDEAAGKIAGFLSRGLNVAFLCEGDPLFFGSFIYLLERLERDHPVEVIPGISSLHAASAALLKPLTQQSQSFAVISGRVKDEHVLQTLKSHETVVILKAGLNRLRLKKLILQAGREHEAHYLSYITCEQQQILPFHQLDDEPGPYFSLFVVTRSP